MSHQHSEMKKEIDEDMILDDVISIKPSGAEYRCNSHEEAYNKIMKIALKPNKYQRKVKSTTIDVYDVLKAFEVNNPATAHAVKKLLASGQRGYKDVIQDLQEAVQSIERAIELESGN